MKAIIKPQTNTNQTFLVSPFSLCVVYVFCSFTLFLTVFFVFQRNDLVLLTLISRYMSSTSESFLKSNNIVDLHKAIVCTSKIFIQCNTGSWCVHKTCGVNIYLNVSVSLLIPVCPECMYSCVCNIKSEYQQKSCHLCQTLVRKVDGFLHKTHSKIQLVLMYLASTSLGP